MELDPIIEIKKLWLEPGDVIVVRLRDQISCEALGILRHAVKEEFPGNKCLVCEEGVDITTMHESELIGH